MYRRLVNEAGVVSEDMEMGRHFHVSALLLRVTEGNGTRHTVCVCRCLSFCCPFSSLLYPGGLAPQLLHRRNSRPLSTVTNVFSVKG